MLDQKNIPDNSCVSSLLSARDFFRGCMVLAFTHAHFDLLMAQCVTREVLGGGVQGKRSSDAAWTDSMSRLERFLEVMGFACV